jgi:hypothetical protein
VRADLGTHDREEQAVSEEALREMGPIDYIILEWPSEPSGEEVVPLLLDPHLGHRVRQQGRRR